MTDQIPTTWQFGPLALDLDPAERLARLRTLRALVRVMTGPRGDTVANALRASEQDNSLLVFACAALDALAPLDRRRILSSYAALAR